MASRYSGVATASFDARQIERQIVAITRTTARRHGRQPQNAQLHDISIYGCRLITGQKHKTNERLLLRIGGSNPVAATVVWSDGAAAGCRFDEPIPSTLVRAITLTGG